jgi:hypothetical protein
MAELDLKIKQQAESDSKILTLNEIIDKKNYKIKDMDQVFNTLKLKNEAATATIKGLEGEKQHLELSLSENRTMKDKFQERSETKQRDY